MNKFIEDGYVSYEIAELLKAKGFDIPVHTFYNPKKIPHWLKLDPCLINRNAGVQISAPSHQMVMKWLREKYKIFIEIGVSIDLNGKYHYSFRLLNSTCKNILEPKDLVKMGFKDTFGEACEEALKYCLENLI